MAPAMGLLAVISNRRWFPMVWRKISASSVLRRSE